MGDNFVDYIEVHYYLKDSSHTMDAVLRNNAEREFLKVIHTLGNICRISIHIETEAYTDGGLKEKFKLIGCGGVILAFLNPSINNLVSHYLTSDKRDKEISYLIQEETLKSLKLDNREKDLQLSDLEEHKHVIRHISNYYRHLSKCDKVEKVGFKVQNEKEQIVTKENFCRFIVEEVKDQEYDEHALIEIISPVLKAGKYKWSGIYHENKIDFSMGDATFKNDIVSGKYTFANGSTIKCRLLINIKYDDSGDEMNRTYSVVEVFEHRQTMSNEPHLTKKGFKKKRSEQQIDLF